MEVKDTLDSLITVQRKAHPREAPKRIAQRVALAVANRPDGGEFARAAIIHYAETQLRSVVRDVERRVFREGVDVRSSDAREQLCAEGFMVGGAWVLWADATATDIEAKIAEFEAERDAIGESISFYRARLDEMRRARVKCWGDLGKKPKRKVA